MKSSTFSQDKAVAFVHEFTGHCTMWCVCVCVLVQNELLEHSIKSLTDELQDVRAERDVFQQKTHRLNVEMNHIVGNDDTRILDIDALCMENRFATNF